MLVFSCHTDLQIFTDLTKSTEMAANVLAYLTTPNGIRYRQPLGLFINNEFVESKSGETFPTIDPAYESPQFYDLQLLTTL